MHGCLKWWFHPPSRHKGIQDHPQGGFTQPIIKFAFQPNFFSNPLIILLFKKLRCEPWKQEKILHKYPRSTCQPVTFSSLLPPTISLCSFLFSHFPILLSLLVSSLSSLSSTAARPHRSHDCPPLNQAVVEFASLDAVSVDIARLRGSGHCRACFARSVRRRAFLTSSNHRRPSKKWKEALHSLFPFLCLLRPHPFFSHAPTPCEAPSRLHIGIKA